MQLQLQHKFYGEVLPYLKSAKNEGEEENPQVEVPDVTGKTIKEAKTILEELGLEYNLDAQNQEDIIKDQLPKAGIKVYVGSRIILYNQ